MKSILRFLALLIGVLFIFAALAAGYLFSGTSSAETRIHYAVRLAEPGAQQLEVTLTLHPAGPTPFVDLYLREPVQEGRQRVWNFSAERNGRRLASWQAVPGFADVVRVWNGFSAQPLTIRYLVDPLWLKGPNSPRSYLGPDFAYIRGMVTLYTPLALEDILRPNFDQPGIDAGFAQMQVDLPAGWKMVSPFGSGEINTPVANLRNSYIGLGPFAISDRLFGKTPFLFGVYEGLNPARQAQFQEQVPMLFEHMQTLTGFIPVSRTCYWSLAVLPADPIHGGASGTGSLVVEDDLEVIAHEMFHWWNGATLISTADANWLKEGFTTYYAARTLRDSGIWSEGQYQQALRSFPQKLWGRGGPQPVNLVSASRRLVRENDYQAYNSVYYGGALLAAFLDQAFQAQGKTLDSLWPALAALQRPVSSRDVVEVIEKLGGADLARQTDNRLNGRVPLVER